MKIRNKENTKFDLHHESFMTQIRAVIQTGVDRQVVLFNKQYTLTFFTEIVLVNIASAGCSGEPRLKTLEWSELLGSSHTKTKN